MRNKILSIGLFLCSACMAVQAQTMTDNQVKNYIQQQGAGKDAKTIGAELLMQGATEDQLSRLYSEYKSGNKSLSTTSKETVNRDRVNNGEKEPASKSEADLALDSKTTVRTIFGHDIFRSKTLSFEPNMSMAVASNYVLGPGDELIVDVYGVSQMSEKYKIAPDGSVTIPRIGPVSVSGMTVAQAQSRIRDVMGQHYENSEIKISVGQTRTIKVSIMGEVVTPGSYTLSAFATVFHALYMAGGVNDLGTLRDVKVARDGRIISTVDVYQYILTGRLAGDVKLRDNDVIIVGSYLNLVEIGGGVKRPMWYEMKKGETVESILNYAGGFASDAFTGHVNVKRQAGTLLSIYTVDDKDYKTFALLDGDSVLVQSNEKRFENLVEIQGAVKRPGQYQVSAAKTLRGLIEMSGGLQEDAERNRAVLIRMNGDRTRRTLSIDLQPILEGTVDDVPLENEDVVEIASLAMLNDERKMYITGEVWYPGSYEYSDNTRIEDLILLAGGLRESASLLNVEVSRRIIDPSASSDSSIHSEVYTFDLSDGLRIADGNDFILKPYDHVSVRRSPVYENQSMVSITGEVNFAGNYTLKNDQVRLSDVIESAGGLKQSASARNARLIRKMNNDEKARALQLHKLASNATDSINVLSLIDQDTYAVAINLEAAMQNPGGKSDVLLRDSDQIIIPKHISTVKISGEVLYPNNVTYIEGEGYRYYINEAGGFTKRSLKRRTYIIYANGHVSKVSKGKIEPGCEIVVPVKEKKERSGDSSKWASVLASIGYAAALLISALK